MFTVLTTLNSWEAESLEFEKLSFHCLCHYHFKTFAISSITIIVNCHESFFIVAILSESAVGSLVALNWNKDVSSFSFTLIIVTPHPLPHHHPQNTLKPFKSLSTLSLQSSRMSQNHLIKNYILLHWWIQSIGWVCQNGFNAKVWRSSGSPTTSCQH